MTLEGRDRRARPIADLAPVTDSGVYDDPYEEVEGLGDLSGDLVRLYRTNGLAILIFA